MLGSNFPISDYYRDNIVEAQTISRSGGWWTAMLVIADPRNGREFIALYKWQSTKGTWKTRNRFLIRKKDDLEAVLRLLREAAPRLDRP